MVLFVYVLYMFLTIPMFRGQLEEELSARSLDSLLQDYAFRAFTFARPKTGIPCDGNVPSNLTGIQVSALRLRSGSLRRRGFESYKEFHIPSGVIEQPYVKRLVLVYHNLNNWSSLYYPLPGYNFLTPVMGLLAYDASNLSATYLSELNIRAMEKPISIMFTNVKNFSHGFSSSSSPMCVYFDLQGSVEFDNVINGSVCSATGQGHFSIVENVDPAAAAPLAGPTSAAGWHGRGKEKNKKKMWRIVGVVVGGGLMLVFSGLVFVWLERCRFRRKIERMEETAESGIPLPIIIVDSSRAPMAEGTRTKPLLENEYLPNP